MLITKKNRIKKNEIKNNEVVSLFNTFGFKTKIYFLFLLILSIITLGMDIYRNLETIWWYKKMYFYFTNQTILFILLTLISFFLKIKKEKIYSLFIYASAVNSLLTFLVYNFFLFPIYTENNIFQKSYKDDPHHIKFISNNLQHIFLPLLYFFFFLFFIPFSINRIKKFFLIFLHPFIYLFIYLLINIFYSYNGDITCKVDGNKCYLPYPNIQCHIHGRVFFDAKKIFINPQERYFLSNFLVFIRIIIMGAGFSLIFIYIFYFKTKVINNKLCHLKRKKG
ncbi:hypothetical protein LFWB_0030 [Candidatus Phytoplasma luffae]|uniref:Uncharacterized protein n=1 Tax=Loofah witches'-broom phytoplasma TaxID=35773 RepID=A0A975ILQ9_LOWBP|nr:hypothetical protein [Candidatus Phytoplasma luffae]QTX02573.1 hypothetical protein LFWB_0030 [Candidatus Phytoplasma luffae]